MTIDDAIAFAKEWSRGVPVDGSVQGWRVVCAVLATEIERLTAREAALSDATIVVSGLRASCSALVAGHVARMKSEYDPCAPWLSEAHALCSDLDIPQGHITDRIRALRDKITARAALADQPAQGEAVAWRFSPYPAAPKFRVLTEDPDAAKFARDCGVAVTELFTVQPAPAVPDGWKLVPVEPTQAMLCAVDDEASDRNLARGRAVSAYKSMLAAAPEAPRG